MAYLKKHAVGAAVTMTLMAAMAVAVPTTAMAASAKVEGTVESKATELGYKATRKMQASVDWTAKTADDLHGSWERLDVSGKVNAFQIKTLPLGEKLKSTILPKDVPGKKVAIWGDRHMSVPAMLLILVFGGAVFVMGRSGPSSRLGGHH